MSNPELQDHLYSLEERLLHPDRERNRTALIPLFAEEFKEFCISGRIFNRQQVIDALLRARRGQPPSVIITSLRSCGECGPGHLPHNDFARSLASFFSLDLSRQSLATFLSPGNHRETRKNPLKLIASRLIASANLASCVSSFCLLSSPPLLLCLKSSQHLRRRPRSTAASLHRILSLKSFIRLT